MSIEYIRRSYSVPAKVGMIVNYRNNKYKITGTSGPYLVMYSVDGPHRIRAIVHPHDDELKYPEVT